MALISLKTATRLAVGGLCIYGVSLLVGPATTANVTTQAAYGSGWGVGMGAGAIPEMPRGAKDGFSASKVAVQP